MLVLALPWTDSTQAKVHQLAQRGSGELENLDHSDLLTRSLPAALLQQKLMQPGLLFCGNMRLLLVLLVLSAWASVKAGEWFKRAC